MSAVATIRPQTAPAAEPKKPRRIAFEQFKKQYSGREDRWKYEWSDGVVEKTLRTMDQSQNSIFYRIDDIFRAIYAGRLPGRLGQEIESFFGGENFRRPDISFFSNAQIARFGKANQVPMFVIEVISSNDQINAVQKKMAEYRAAEVEVVWLIFPKLKEVHVCRGDQTTIFKGSKKVSAAPVLPELELLPASLFD